MSTSILSTAVPIVLATAMLVSAAIKLSRRPAVVRAYERVGVPGHRLWMLALLLVAGAAGLLAGLASRPLAIAAAGATAVYFAGAIGAHVRARDLRPLPAPIALFAMAVAALALRL